MISTNKKCDECGHNLLFDEESVGAELSCKKCGAIYEYRNYIQCLKTGIKPTNFNPKKLVEPVKLKEEPMASKKGKCVKCGEERSLIAKGLCCKCYTAQRNNKPAGKRTNRDVIVREVADLSGPLRAFTNQIKILALKELISDIQEKIQELEKKGD